MRLVHHENAIVKVLGWLRFIHTRLCTEYETYRFRKRYNEPLPLQILLASLGSKSLSLHHMRWDPPTTGTGTQSAEFEIRI